MTKRFNLLPAHYAEQIAERRRTVATAGALVLLLVALGVDVLAQGRQLARAEKQREVEQRRNAELQDRRRQLQPFRQLADGIIGRERMLTAGMQTHVSWATVLSGLSRTLPADASLTSFTANLALPAFGTLPATQPGSLGTVIGATEVTGYSVNRFTPGVDRLLQSLGAVAGLAEPRLQVGNVEKVGAVPVTTFEGNTFIDAKALTGRYAKGLPPEDDVDVGLTPRTTVPAASAPTTSAPAAGSAPRPSR